MIAGDPDPFAAALQRTQRVAVAIPQPRRAAAVMKAVAERHDAAWRVVRNQMRQPRECCRGIVRRKQLPTRGKTRTFLQMQIGDGQQPMLRPIERAARVDEQWNLGEDNEITLASRQISCRLAQLIASLINSSAASANSVSDASP